jgi:hypothetical protein
MRLWGDEQVEVDLVPILVETFGEAYKPEQTRALLRDVCKRGLLRRDGRRYLLTRPKRVDDATLGGLIACELREQGRGEEFFDVLSRKSVALASLGLSGRSAIDRMAQLADCSQVHLSYLMGRERFVLTA